LTLQLGSGLSKLDGAINVDINIQTRPNVVCDLDQIPYPFHSDTFEVVIALSTLEHLKNFFAVMGEIHRIAKAGASVYILTPHFSDAASFVDPTHYQHFSARSFDYFIEGSTIELEYGFYAPHRYRLVRRLIELAGPLNYLAPLRWFVNRNPTFWETYLCYLIRGDALFLELEVLK
jgi:SAM-dependent methyltransferase